MSSQEVARESRWLRFNHGAGEACPAMGWKNIFKRLVTPTAESSGNHGLGVIVYGGLKENIATAVFGNISEAKLYAALSEASHSSSEYVLCSTDKFQQALQELEKRSRPCIPNLGMFAITVTTGSRSVVQVGNPPTTEVAQVLYGRADAELTAAARAGTASLV